MTGASIPGHTRSSAAVTYRQKRAGSLSPASSDSHAADWRLRRAQSPSMVVLPKPAGVLTTVSPRPIPSARRASSRGRGTKPARGTWNLVATCTSRSGAAPPPARLVVGCSAITSPWQPAVPVSGATRTWPTVGIWPTRGAGVGHPASAVGEDQLCTRPASLLLLRRGEHGGAAVRAGRCGGVWAEPQRRRDLAVLAGQRTGRGDCADDGGAAGGEGVNRVRRPRPRAPRAGAGRGRVRRCDGGARRAEDVL